MTETSHGTSAEIPGQAAGGGIRLGISACLLGEKVRYDGGHRRDTFLVDTLGRYVEWVPVCPEVECGLSVPREAMRLVGDPQSPRLMTRHSGRNLTKQMLSWARRRVAELEAENLCGYIFKSRSPSCDEERVKVYDRGGSARKVGVGMFARAFMEHFPLLPVEEEGRLHDPAPRENFVERVFTLRRYRDMVRARGTRGALVEFHADHKLLLMSHSVERLREMGRLVARARELSPRKLFAEYGVLMLATLKLRATPKKHTNCLQHMMGYLKKLISDDEKQELPEVIGRFKSELQPLVVPVTLVTHYARKYRVDYLLRQVYLNPHPVELKLQNHA